MKPRPKSFHFCGYMFNVQKKNIVFRYKIEFLNQDSLEFEEIITLPKVPVNYNKEVVKKTLQALELILGISYYKLYCPSKIVTSFDLSQEQADFWNIVYRKGLGEFLYQNKLKPEQLAKFPYLEGVKTESKSIEVENKILLGIGGGKDSIVAAELLKNNPMWGGVTSFVLETQKIDLIAESVMKRIGNSSLKIRRGLDIKIFEEHPNSYNGHIPISAIIAFTGFLSAILYGYKYVVVANEYSSDFGNVEYCGEEINHQWSKSMEFEELFQEYTNRFITKSVKYFSLIRQFHELRVAQIFAENCEKYFQEFTSCNKNFKIYKERSESLWCGKCPKCAFVFLILAPFINKKKLIKIFGKNILADKKLIFLFKDLLGFGKVKPFDCVGTFEEARVALHLVQNKYKDSIIIKTFKSKIKVSQEMIDNVFKTYPALTLPTPFRFLGIKTVGILGYGREGEITEKYLKKNYPSLEIGILDGKFDKGYLSRQEDYDLIIKTPGVPNRKIIRPYTTATNIFFSQNKNLTIGITGSKGKSTVSSLIYEIIKKSGKKVRLIGNIGKPMLEVLLSSNIDSDEIFVMELSSYMLDDIEYSPNIAVLLNFFPEHLDYHGGIENYRNAKENIFKFQGENDQAFRFPFKDLLKINDENILLKGVHNLENIRAAVQVAKSLNIENKIIKKVIKEFKPLFHRLEFVGRYEGVDFYDDAISTTPESTIAAIKTLESVNTIFLGGEDRGYEFKELEKIIRKYGINNIVLFPDTGSRVLQSWKGFNVLETESMKEAVNFAFKNTEKGKICLLSMASPSYSLWKNFEEKGDLFQKIVREFGD